MDEAKLSKLELEILDSWIDELSVRLRIIVDYVQQPELFPEAQFGFVDDDDVEAELRVPEGATPGAIAASNVRRMFWMIEDAELQCINLPKHDLVLEAHALLIYLNSELAIATHGGEEEDVEVIIEAFNRLAPQFSPQLKLCEAKLAANWGFDDRRPSYDDEPEAIFARKTTPEDLNTIRKVLSERGKTIPPNTVESELRAHGWGMNRQRMLNALRSLYQLNEYKGYKRPPK